MGNSRRVKKNKGAVVESSSAYPSAESWPSHSHHSLLQGFAAPHSKADSAGGGLSHLQLHKGGGDVDHGPVEVPTLSHPALGQASPKAAAAGITWAPQFGCFYVHFPQIFQFSGPKQLEVALGANSHKFCCLPTLPSHPKPQVLLAAVNTRTGVCPIAVHTFPGESPHSQAGNTVTHMESGAASDPNAN